MNSVQRPFLYELLTDSGSFWSGRDLNKRTECGKFIVILLEFLQLRICDSAIYPGPTLLTLSNLALTSLTLC